MIFNELSQATPMEFFLIGYFPKRRTLRSSWNPQREDGRDFQFPAPPSVNQICSVSNCIVKGISVFDYQEISMKSFNEYRGFNQLEKALEIMANTQGSEFDLFAYAIPEFIYQDGQMVQEEIGCVDPDEIADNCTDFVHLGYDVVENRNNSFFCSPLSCNGQAGLHLDKLNQYCLIEHESDALDLATLFSIEKPEPGPYTVVQVWRYRS